MCRATRRDSQKLASAIRFFVNFCLKLSGSHQARFSQIEITLDTPQRVIVDDSLVPQTDDGLSFNTERFALQALILWSGNFAAAIVGVRSAKLQLFHPLVV